MKHDRTKGSAGIRIHCGRCRFIRIVTGVAGSPPEPTPEEDALIAAGEAEIWESTSPPGAGDMCPRCMGDGWVFVHPD